MENQKNKSQNPSNKKNERKSSPENESNVKDNDRGSDDNASKNKERRGQGTKLRRGEDNSTDKNSQ